MKACFDFPQSKPAARVAETAYGARTAPDIFQSFSGVMGGSALAGARVMGEKRFVYVIQSTGDAAQHYVGLTWNVMTRLASHNAGESPHTRRHRPWRLVVAMAFATEEKAVSFEKYLKSATGSAFVRRHLL